MDQSQIRVSLNEYILKDIDEVSGDHAKKEFRTGSDASVIELSWHGTPCVGKELHPIFFQGDLDRNGKQRIVEKFCREIDILSKMKHPNIVQFMGLYYRKSTVPIMVMEKMECSLTELINKTQKGSIPLHKIVKMLSDVARGLIYLHVIRNVVHRDLSSNNILIAPFHYCAKIADLGSARILDVPGGWRRTQQLTLQPGTQDFMPPEALEYPPRYGLSVDIFSFGCAIIHLVSHQWPTPSGKTSGREIVSEWNRRRMHFSDFSSSHPLFSLARHCLEDDADNRPSSKEVLLTLETAAKRDDR